MRVDCLPTHWQTHTCCATIPAHRILCFGTYTLDGAAKVDCVYHPMKTSLSSSASLTVPYLVCSTHPHQVDVNGPGAEPMFNYLKSQKGGLLGNDIKWNFSKFLVDKDGNVVSAGEPAEGDDDSLLGTC